MHLPPTRLAPALALLAAACGATPVPEPDAPAPPGTPPAVPEDGVRLGCERIPQAAIDAEAARLAAAHGEPLDDETRRTLQTRAEETLVRRALVERDAEWLGIVVPDDQVDRAIAGVMQQNNLDAAAFAEAIDQQGLDMAEYRAEVARQLLEFKVVSAVAHPRVSEADIRAEYGRLAAEVDAGSLRTFDEAREEIRGRLVEARMEENRTRHFERARRFLAALEIEGEGEACVERWPELTPSEFRFEGNAALDGDDLRFYVAQAVEPAGTVRVGSELPETVRLLLLAGYMDHGYVDAAFEVEELTTDQVVVRVREGALFRLGRFRVVVRAPDGTETEPPGGEAAWRPLLSLAEGDVFARRAIGDFLPALGETLARAWEVETTDVTTEVETEAGNGAIDVTVVVRRRYAQ